MMLLAFVVLLLLPEVEQRTRLQPDFNIFTVAQDIELGRIAAQEMESQSVVLQNSDVTAYLNTLGNTLVTKAPQSSLFHFGVNLDKRVRGCHPLRKVDEIIDFRFVSDEVKSFY